MLSLPKRAVMQYRIVYRKSLGAANKSNINIPPPLPPGLGEIERRFEPEPAASLSLRKQKNIISRYILESYFTKNIKVFCPIAL